MSAWNRYVEKFFQEVLFQQEIPIHGMIVEMGVFRCVSFEKLCRQFGADRCLGFDIVNYARHSRVIEMDIRQLERRHDVPISIGWNDASLWAKSPATKKAAADYILRNLVVGGFYIDEARDGIPADFNLHGLRLIHERSELTLFRKSE